MFRGHKQDKNRKRKEKDLRLIDDFFQVTVNKVTVKSKIRRVNVGIGDKANENLTMSLIREKSSTIMFKVILPG